MTRPTLNSSDNAPRNKAGESAVQRGDVSDRPETADVDRAQQRLTQETVRNPGSVPETAEQARALTETIRQQLSADPAAALRATGNATDTLFEAATARPTA